MTGGEGEKERGRGGRWGGWERTGCGEGKRGREWELGNDVEGVEKRVGRGGWRAAVEKNGKFWKPRVVRWEKRRRRGR